MQNVQANITEYETAKHAVLEHCMCFKFVEEPGRFIVFFPAGYMVDAAQMRYGEEKVTKTKALQLLLVSMEKYWKIG